MLLIPTIVACAVLAIAAFRPSVDNRTTLCVTCPPGFELTSNNTCKLRTMYQLYESDSGEAAGVGGLKTALPASTAIDAHVEYKILSAHSTIKLGATNLTNKYYSTGIANPMIGGMYYISLGYNLF